MMKIWMCFLFCCCLHLWCGAQQQNPTGASLTGKSLTGYTFQDIKDKDFRFSDLKGYVVYIDIWAIGCKPCLMELSHVKTLMEDNRDKPVRFVSVCVENNVNAWKEFVGKRKLPGIHIIAPILCPFLKENGFIGVPRFVLLDKNGRIVVSKAKAPSDPDVQKQLDQWMKR